LLGRRGEREPELRNGAGRVARPDARAPAGPAVEPPELRAVELARVDVAAARRGVTREAMLVILAKIGLNDAEAGSEPPADDGPTAPPPSRKRRQ
jgi:hypothetical protein